MAADNLGLTKRDLLLAILVTAIWGANFSVIRIGLSDLDPFLLAALRFLCCAFPLIFFVKASGVPMKIVGLYGVLFGVGMWGVVNLAIYNGVSAGLASLVIQSSAFFTILLSGLVFKEKVTRLQGVGLLLGALGLVVIMAGRAQATPLFGLVLVLFASAAWSICNVIIKRYKPKNLLAFSIWSSLFAVVPLFLLTYLVKGAEPFTSFSQHLSVSAVLSVLFQAYVTTILGYWIWNWLLTRYAAIHVTPMALLVPVFGVLTSMLVFGERLTLTTSVSAALIISGVAVLSNAAAVGRFVERLRLQRA